MSSIISSQDDSKSCAKPSYTTHRIISWFQYQQIVPSSHHSIQNYEQWCKEQEKLCKQHVMVLMDKVVKIKGMHYVTGWPCQNCADTDGYVDVRSGKHYPYGTSSFFEDMR